MKPLLKSEFLKLITVRSTYIWTLIAAVLTAVYCFYIEGFKGMSGSAASQRTEGSFNVIIQNISMTTTIFAAIVAVLYIVHEYRYNLITYTLSSAGSRTRVLVAKLFMMIAYAIIFTLFFAAFGLACYYLGVLVSGDSLATQIINIELLGRLVIFCVGYVLIGLAFGFITRSVAASIVLLFLVPSTIEPLLGFLLKENVNYLPFRILENIIITSQFSAAQAIAIFTGYIFTTYVVVWFLFIRRDAN